MGCPWRVVEVGSELNVPSLLVAAARQIAKDSDSAALSLRSLMALTRISGMERNLMAGRTCAACNCQLDANPIKVMIGGKTVEVCCDECAQKLKEAHVSATTPSRG